VYGDPGKSFAEQLAERFSAKLINRSLPGGSNQRIIRTSVNDLKFLDPAETIVLIGWSSFERAEWYYNNQWHNLCGSAAYNLPEDLLDVGNQHLNSFKTNRAYQINCHLEQHQQIWNFHNHLIDQGYRFLFFQGCQVFFFCGIGDLNNQDRNFCLPWRENSWAHNPYGTFKSNIESFSHFCLAQGFQHTDQYAHFGQDAHNYWADFLTPKIQNLIN
jgi:hypothetical protein